MPCNMCRIILVCNEHVGLMMNFLVTSTHLLQRNNYFWPPHLRFGLPRFRFSSTVICNILLSASSLFCLCTSPNHLNHFPEKFCSPQVRVCLLPDVYISHTVSSCLSSYQRAHLFQLCNFLSFCPPFCLSFNFVGMFLSHIIPVVSLHFDQVIFRCCLHLRVPTVMEKNLVMDNGQKK